MSRGLGRIERAILTCIEEGRRPLGSFTPHGPHISSHHVISVCFPTPHYPTPGRNQKPTPAQRKAIWRAMYTVVRKYPQYALMGGKGRTSLWLYEPADPESTLWAELAVKYRCFIPRSDVHRVAEGGKPEYALSHLRGHRQMLRRMRLEATALAQGQPVPK